MKNEFLPQQELKKEEELYPKKSFEEMKNDVLSGRWKNMKDVYWSGGHGEDVISERAENGHIVLRNIMLGWDDENKKVINKIVAVNESVFDKRKNSDNKVLFFFHFFLL